MNFSAWAIRNPFPVSLLFVFVCLGGIVGFEHVGITAMPVIDVPVISIDARYPGATPSQVESDVTRKIEDSIAGIGSVRNLTSTVTEGSSNTTVDFNLAVNPRDALDRVRGAVGRIRAELPAGVVDPVITPVDHSDVLLSYAVSSTQWDQEDLSRFVDTELARNLLAIEGVARITRTGGVDREIDVDLDAPRLRVLKGTVSDISTQLAAALRETPGGRVTLGGLEQSLRVMALGGAVEQLRQMQIALPGGASVRLGSIARVTDGVATARQLALLDGKPVIAVQIDYASGANEVAVAAAVRRAITRLAQAHPAILLREIGDAVQPIRNIFNTAMSALYEGCVLAVVVVWIFLRDWRATVVTAFALPLSIMPTYLALAWLGFTFNQLTLLALILVIGVLVDDAIVEVENIARHMRMGKSPLKAALEATAEIYIAVIATSLTLVAVFLPTAFMGGVIGKYFKEFGWTVAIAVLASLLVARLVTPMMAVWLLRNEGEASAQSADGRLMRWYLAGVGRCLAHPLKTALAGAVLCCASLVLLARLPQSFLPGQDESRIVVNLRTAPGSGLDATRDAAQAAQRAAMGITEIESTLATIGANSGDTREATLTYTLVPREERARSQAQVETELHRRLVAIPGVRFSVSTQDSGQAVSILLAGDEPELLHQSALEVERQLRGLPGLGFVSSSASLLRPELEIEPDKLTATRLGVSNDAIGQALRAATAGDTSTVLPRLNLPGRQVPLRVRLDPAQAILPETLATLLVPGKNGSVPLSAVAHVTQGSEPAQIDRRDRNRTVTLTVELGGRPLGDVSAQVDALPALRHLPLGVQRISGGDGVSLDDLFGQFSIAMSLGVLCIYLMLAVLFRGLLVPAAILVALPLSVSGVALALTGFGLELSLASLLGILMLMGITTKNSILLVDYVIAARRDHGTSRSEAILDACRKRARPIVMTSIAMMAGMLPLVISTRSDLFRSTMGLTVMSGLATSTVLSLLLVPTAFVLFDGLQHRATQRWPRFD